MRLGRLLGISFAGVSLALVLGGAQRPLALAQTMPGLWVLSGTPGTKAPARQCVADVAALAQFEHRGKSCSRQVLRDSASSTTIEYHCAGSDFGRSEIGVVTPRSLRIETQGISDGLPFHYVLQARRVGECPTAQTAQRH
jgi:hypothetical protein